MKLQKQLSRKVGKTKYSKFVITLPPIAIKELSWKSGDELDFIIKNNQLILNKKRD
jgi:antitoxin component of MazEF toxin-antitoxin module